MIKKAVCILSGGMDSALAAYKAKVEGYEIIALHFDYGQRTQNREKEAFYDLCNALDVKAKYCLDLAFLGQIGGSALTDTNIEVPTSGVEDGTVPITYVPFRNGIFLSIAASIAEKEDAEALYIGVVEEDSSGYPDCREEYMLATEKAINLGTKDETNLMIKRPLVSLSKAQIVSESIALEVPLNLTWSCYKSQERACGICDSCRLRLAGFKKAGITDPIPYQQ